MQESPRVRASLGSADRHRLAGRDRDTDGLFDALRNDAFRTCIINRELLLPRIEQGEIRDPPGAKCSFDRWSEQRDEDAVV